MKEKEKRSKADAMGSTADKAASMKSNDVRKGSGKAPDLNPDRPQQQSPMNAKQEQLEAFRVDDRGTQLTTNQGVKMAGDEFSLKAGERGPTLMEDFHFREKLTHFDHERIPERIVHARGTGAHGVFTLTESMSEYTKAAFLQNPGEETPVFVRFSTVVGFRGSADTVRDVRGFATKFYTKEGVYDLVGNNMPIFFIQDAIKFPDLVHSIKPEQDTEVPQASAAHDTFWDFVGRNQESAHMIMWAMSDRALPRSYRMMDGFGVHTFRFVNAAGKSTFVKLHYKARLGVHSLVWDETQLIAGRDPDFNRKDLYEAISQGNFPEWDVGAQLLPEEDEFRFDFDILDPTKIWPEEDVPIKFFGRLTLNKNVDNFFAETEQVAFHPGHVVPGIDFTNDPLLQGRLFSYTDTQLLRLGGPNFHEIPINRSVAQPHNNQREGIHRMTINKGPVAYNVNSLNNGDPRVATPAEGGFESYQEKIDAVKIRNRSKSFEDHFSQAVLFYNSMSEPEKKHIIDAFSFELGKVKSEAVRQTVVDMFGHVNNEMMTIVAERVGCRPPDPSAEMKVQKASPVLSQENTVKSPMTRKLMVIVGSDSDGAALGQIAAALEEAGAKADFVAEMLGPVKAPGGEDLVASETFTTTDSVVYDGVLVAGSDFKDMRNSGKARMFIHHAFMHYKPIGFLPAGRKFLEKGMDGQPGIYVGDEGGQLGGMLVEGLTQHRFWSRDITAAPMGAPVGSEEGGAKDAMR